MAPVMATEGCLRKAIVLKAAPRRRDVSHKVAMKNPDARLRGRTGPSMPSVLRVSSP